MLTNFKMMGMYASIMAFIAVTAIVTNGMSISFDNVYGGAIQSLRNENLNIFVEFITYLGNWQTIVILCILLMLKSEKVRMRVGIPVTLVAIMSSVINKICKVVIERPRPDAESMLIEQGGWSYPSGHTTTAVAVCVMIAFILVKNNDKIVKKITIALGFVVLMTMIAVSRVYLGVHYASDVFGGYFLGLSSFCILSLMLFQKKTANLKWNFRFLDFLPTFDKKSNLEEEEEEK